MCIYIGVCVCVCVCVCDVSLWDRSAPVAVVRSGPHRENRLVEVPLVPLHNELVRSADHVDVVSGVELGHDVTPEQISGSPRTHAPSGGVCSRDSNVFKLPLLWIMENDLSCSV